MKMLQEDFYVILISKKLLTENIQILYAINPSKMGQDISSDCICKEMTYTFMMIVYQM